MTDEIKAAAERYRAYLAAPNLETLERLYGYGAKWSCVDNDEKILAQAYLADYAAAQLEGAEPGLSDKCGVTDQELEWMEKQFPFTGRAAAAEIRSLRRQLAAARQEAADATHNENVTLTKLICATSDLIAARADSERLRKELERCRDSFGSAGWYQQMAIVNHVLASAPDAGPSDAAKENL